ncbi:hypothetical protein VC83_01448 [Pseudogymnoascus destructans]|uniref:WW domain-containing protein n=2 Tax=Pseudogymnoascus destructans TaxID=655981 RepID=L8FR15_PSED2|nr:uncharacterized protein VC83_01448 [Pseudogymnoascus destructans]ELR02989.1 hypothetical protein GMDG_05844 [Pseudogymnoascus destructans 20631-21]OAF61741.1 hypothetical protein VC83_01448 [Pseudogymnoascus destructans]
MATPTSDTPNKPQDFEETVGHDLASTEPAQHNATTSNSESLPTETELPEEDTVASASRKGKEPEDTSAPPLPDEEPPLPDEEPPAQEEKEDDGWAPVWDATAGSFYFYNRFTQATQWENPRVPDATAAPAVAPGVDAPAPIPEEAPPRPAAGGYDPAIHGDYDETAWYAQPAEADPAAADASVVDPTAAYAATGAFNRFTGRWQATDLTPENFNDENKSKRQMNAFFDVDAAANSHDGRSLKAERSGKKLSKNEVKLFKQKRKARKEEKRRAWLLD